MKDIVLDLKGSFVNEDEMKSIESEIMAAHELLITKKGISSEMTGWIDYVDSMNKKEYDEIKKSAEYIKNNCEAFILLGIGGSYLGARASIEAIRGDFQNELSVPKVYYAGQNLSGSSYPLRPRGSLPSL